MLKIKSPISDVFRKDFEIDQSYLSPDPTNSNSTYLTLEDGIWVKIVAGKAYHIHTSNGGTAGTVALNVGSTAGSSGEIIAQVFNEKGDYGMQALNKVTLLLLGQYVAETDKVHGTPAVGDLLTVDQKGNLKTAAASGDIIVAQALSYNSSGSTLEFIRVSPYVLY